MKDEREFLYKELINIGIDEHFAFEIALDAGSSQTFVNKDYLKDFEFDNKKLRKVLNVVGKWYVGYYSN